MDKDFSSVGTQYIICECGDNFPNEIFLNIHLANGHGEVDTFLCDVCLEAFPSTKLLLQHKLTHKSETPKKPDLKMQKPDLKVQKLDLKIQKTPQVKKEIPEKANKEMDKKPPLIKVQSLKKINSISLIQNLKGYGRFFKIEPQDTPAPTVVERVEEPTQATVKREPETDAEDSAEEIYYQCDVCNSIFYTEADFNVHYQSEHALKQELQEAPSAEQILEEHLVTDHSDDAGVKASGGTVYYYECETGKEKRESEELPENVTEDAAEDVTDAGQLADTVKYSDSTDDNQDEPNGISIGLNNSNIIHTDVNVKSELFANIDETTETHSVNLEPSDDLGLLEVTHVKEIKKRGRPKKKKVGRPPNEDVYANMPPGLKNYQVQKLAMERKKEIKKKREQMAREKRKKKVEALKKASAEYAKTHPEALRKAPAKNVKAHTEVNRSSSARNAKTHPEVNTRSSKKYAEKNKMELQTLEIKTEEVEVELDSILGGKQAYGLTKTFVRDEWFYTGSAVQSKGCHKIFANEKYFNIHYNKVHGGLLPIEEEETEEATQEQDTALSEDMETEDVSADAKHKTPEQVVYYKCDLCKILYPSEKAYNTHFDKKHGGQSCQEIQSTGFQFIEQDLAREYRPAPAAEVFACEFCPKSFSIKRSLQVHRKRMHYERLKGPEGAEGAESRAASRSKVCDICGRAYNSNAALRYHQRRHTGEKPYPCTICPKRFTMPMFLQIHMRTHTGEKPYACPHCPKAFTNKAALIRHDRVHTGVKPYPCPECGKFFTQSNSMKLHVSTVHLKLPAPYKSKSRRNKSEARALQLALKGLSANDDCDTLILAD